MVTEESIEQPYGVNRQEVCPDIITPKEFERRDTCQLSVVEATKSAIEEQMVEVQMIIKQELYAELKTELSSFIVNQFRDMEQAIAAKIKCSLDGYAKERRSTMERPSTCHELPLSVSSELCLGGRAEISQVAADYKISK